MQLTRITRPDGTRFWVGTQTVGKKEAKACGGTWEVIDIPITPKEDLLAFVNDMQEQIMPVPVAAPAPAAPPPTEAEPPAFSEDEQTIPALRERGSIAMLARMDEGKAVDEIVEIIGRSKKYALARFASAVAIAFGRYA